MPQAHDLLFVSEIQYIHQPFIGFSEQELHSRPVVVRRDILPSNLIPIGVRGKTRTERFAAGVLKQHLLQITTPEEIVKERKWLNSNHQELDKHWQTLEKIDYFMRQNQIEWGLLGSLGFELVSHIPTGNGSSDIDLRICYKTKPPDELLTQIHYALSQLPIAVDIQIETPIGGFALHEWILKKSAMMKTNRGPLITTNHWFFRE